MDATHINLIGQHLSQLSNPPCCYSAKAQARVSFDPTPSRLTYHHLVDHLPLFDTTSASASLLPSRHHIWNLKTNYSRWRTSATLTPLQTTSIATFRPLYTQLSTNNEIHDITLSTITIFAASLDALLFASRVLPRCSIAWYTAPPATHSGEVQFAHTCLAHHQTHTVRMLLTRPAPLPSDLELRQQRLDDMLGLLLHELCHAYTFIFAKQCCGIEDTLVEHGPTGHGLVWENVMKVGCWAVADLLGVVVDEEIWLDSPADGDADVVARMVGLERWIEEMEPGREALERKVAEELDVSVDGTKEYFVLREEGFEALEVISLLAGWDLGHWGKGEVRDVVPDRCE